MKMIFIGDAHLKDSTDPELKSLCKFLDEQEKFDKLVIMGDLFDLWAEGNTVAMREYKAVLHSLKRIAGLGVEIIYLEGNHDFAMGSFFTGELGARVFPDHHVMEIDGKRLYLSHGDNISMAPGHWVSRILLRSPLLKFLLFFLPDKAAWDIAGWFSRRSRGYGAEKPSVERNQKAFARKLIEGGIDGVVLGHSHSGGVHHDLVEGKSGVYANPGGWVNSETFLLYEDGDFKLEKFTG